MAELRYPSINQIAPRIFVGNFAASQDLQTLETHRITHLINAAIELEFDYNTNSRSVVHLHLDDVPQQDIFPILEPSRMLIDKILSNPKSVVLIHCFAGMSRSVSVCIYYLNKSENPELVKDYDVRQYRCYDRVLALVKKARPIAQPNSGFEKTLRSVCVGCPTMN